MSRELLQQALDALEKVTQFAEAQICMHEETYRGGVLWEICSQCGAKWADDEGGKPKFKWPKETNAARKTIASLRAALAQPEPEPVLWVPPEREGEFHHDHSSVTGYRNRRAGWVPLYATPPAAPIDGFGGNLDEAFERAPAVPLTDDMVEAEFVSRGDDKGQGLHPYWKDAFREGFNFARSHLSAAPAVPLTDEQVAAGIAAWFTTKIAGKNQPFEGRMRAAYAAIIGGGK